MKTIYFVRIRNNLFDSVILLISLYSLIPDEIRFSLLFVHQPFAKMRFLLVRKFRIVSAEGLRAVIARIPFLFRVCGHVILLRRKKGTNICGFEVYKQSTMIINCLPVTCTETDTTYCTPCTHVHTFLCYA